MGEGEDLPESEGLDRLLNQLGEDGEAHSEGAFTISLESAQEKLAAFQLPNPRCYVLNALASAVSAGAEYAEFCLDSGGLTLEFDGVFTRDELRNLMGEVLQPSHPRLHEMGVALNAASQLSLTRLELESCAGEVAELLYWENQSWHLREIRHSELSEGTTRLTVSETAGLRRVYVSRLQEIFEQKMLTELGCFAPLRLLLDGDVLSSKPALPESATRLAVRTLRPASSRWNYDPESLSSHCAPLSSAKLELPVDGLLGMDLKVGAHEAGWKLLCRGVSFAASIDFTGVPFVCGVVEAGFQKDLSHTGLVQDALYKRVRAEVTQAAEEMVVERLFCSPPLPKNAERELMAWGSLLLQRLRARGDSERASAVRCWMAEVRFLENPKDESRWKEVCSELRSVAKGYRERSADRLKLKLLEASLRALQSANLPGCVALCRRLRELGESVDGDWVSIPQAVVACLNGLVGGTFPEAGSPDLSCEFYRLVGDLGRAEERAASGAQKAEVFLAQGRWEEAFKVLQSKLESSLAPTVLLDLLSCCEAGLREVSEESVQTLKERLLSTVVGDEESWSEFLRRELFRSSVGFVRSTASMLGLGNLRGYVGELDRTLADAEASLKGSRGTGLVSVRLAVLSAERILELEGQAMNAVRTRAIHLLRRYGHWEEADRIRVRGQILFWALKQLYKLQAVESR